ncbi:endonuclease/exonuclease/phosphatase family protein [Streptomyces sp. NBC_00572]|uniref:endonuclease/exonuclease/phosphatase family protein n=1 Tax=Streptomyces sp. NBC_00572 TaxID=2903664 RepID=UPI00225BDEA2|nr:endonuclease/exonuclease/phosphatase family protein [Streptomyces sp. NBC_00572]MCX4981951.1 endonuclease/exonuclease/phosphatase family protein [Streptomyces sp. NBC_00572]
MTSSSPTPPPREQPLRPRHRVTAWAAGLLLVVPALVTACRALDTDAVTPIPQLLSFLPWLTVPAGLALLLAAAARRRVLTFAAVLVLTATAWSSVPYMPQTVISYGLPLARVKAIAANVEFGQGTRALTGVIRRERPQLVFVSECDRACRDTLTKTFATELPHYATVDGEGSVGSILLSAYPLRDWRMIPAAMGMPGATADIAGVPVRLQLAHPLPPLPGQVHLWKRELARIKDFAARHAQGPTLIAGDFNASQDHAAFRAILAAGGLQDASRRANASRTPTWPMEGPLPPYVQIDHVLVNGFSVRDVRFLDLAGSDHRAVLADLDLRGPR